MRGLTSVFGMGTGVTPSLLAPARTECSAGRTGQSKIEKKLPSVGEFFRALRMLPCLQDWAVNATQDRTTKRKLLIFAGILLALIGGAQLFIHFFPGIILSAMTRYYAFQANVEQRFVDIEGYRIPYYRGGEGPTLVLVHGFGDSKIRFLQTASFLTDSYDVILLDLPGFGDTEQIADRNYSIRRQAETLNKFLETIQTGPVYLAGNSMGGHIGAALTLMHPDQVRKLVLLNAAGLRVDDPVPYKPAEAPLRTVDDFDKSIGEMFKRKPYIPTAFKIHFVANSQKNFLWLNRIRQDIREGKDYILNDRAASILTQTLIIWGDSDTVVSPAHAQVWSRLLPNSTLIILDQTGHAPQYERPEDTALILKSFLL